MSVRHTDLSTTVFSIEGTNLLAHIRSTDLQLTNTLVDARGASRYAVQAQTKRSATYNFTIQNADGSTPLTNLSVTALEAGSLDYLADWKSFTVALTNSTADGSGGRDAFTFANYVGGSTLEVTMDIQIGGSVAHQPGMVAMLSNTATDRVFAMEIGLGNEVITGNAVLQSVGVAYQRGSILMAPHTFQFTGAPTATPGTTLIGKALTGTGGDSLWTIIQNTGAGIGTATDARVQSLTISVSDAEVQTISGVMALAGAPTFATSA